MPKGKSQQIGNVPIKIKDFKSVGKNMKSFDENKSAIYEWISIFVEIQNVDKRPVQAVNLYQGISLTDQSGADYLEDSFLSIDCKDVDIDQIIRPQQSVTFCYIFDALNQAQNLYWKTYSDDFSTELKFLLR